MKSRGESGERGRTMSSGVRAIKAMPVLLLISLAVPAASDATYKGQNGRIAYERGNEIWTISPSGTKQKKTIDDKGITGAPAFSPNGKKLAYHSTRLEPGAPSVWMANVDGTNQILVHRPEIQKNYCYLYDGTKTEIFSKTHDLAFDPYFTKSGSKILFRSKTADPPVACPPHPPVHAGPTAGVCPSRYNLVTYRPRSGLEFAADKDQDCLRDDYTACGALGESGGANGPDYPKTEEHPCLNVDMPVMCYGDIYACLGGGYGGYDPPGPDKPFGTGDEKPYDYHPCSSPDDPLIGGGNGYKWGWTVIDGKCYPPSGGPDIGGGCFAGYAKLRLVEAKAGGELSSGAFQTSGECWEAFNGPVPSGDAEFTSDGKLLVFSHVGGGLGAAPANGGKTYELFSNATAPSVSPASNRIAFQRLTAAGIDIFSANLDGSGAIQLTESAGSNSEPVFSPDGKQIAFTSTRTGNSEIFVMNVDGSNEQQITTTPENEFRPDWGPADPPNTKITSGVTGITNDTPQTFKFRAEPANAPGVNKFQCGFLTEFQIENSPTLDVTQSIIWKNCNNKQHTLSKTDLGADGGYTFYVRAIDSDGIVDPTPDTRSFTLDTVPPDTLITESPLGTVGGQQNLVFKQQAVGPVGTIVGASPFVCKLGIQGKALKQVNAFPKKCNSTLNLKPDDGLYDKSGTYVYTAAARDAAGNVDQTPAESLPFIVDADGPDVKIIPPSPEKVTSDQTPSLYFEGPEDAVGFQCRFIFGNDKPGPDDKFKDCTSGKPSKKLKEGSWRFEVIALDAFGNVGKKASRVFKIDKKGPPKTEITSGPEGVVTELSPFTFKANRKDAEFDCALQPEGSQGKLKYSECSSPKSYPSQPDGEYTLYVRGFVPGAKGKDDAVFEKPPATRTFTVDTTSPTVEITSGPDFAGNPGQPTASFTYSASESARFTCSVGLAAAVVVSEADCNDPAGFTSGPLASGDYIFRVIARDTAGLHGSAARTFSIDTSPETTITSRPAESSSDHGPAWTFVSSTPGSTFSCRLSKQGDTLGGFFPCSSPFRASLAVGNRTFEVFATDPHGVSDPSPATDGFFITEQLLWGNYGNGSGTTIGRANLDGTGVDHNFITGASGPCSVAMDENHIYWTNQSSDSIGRAKLDGTGVNQNFITTGDQPCGIAVNGSHVYWSEYGNDSVNRRPVDGSGSNQMIIQSFGAPDPDFIALDSNFLYFSHDGNAVHPGLIGRANLDGTGLNTGFIDPNGGGGDPDPPTNPTGVAVNSTHIFIANTDPQAIQRATIAGTGNMNIVNGSVEACGVAVSSNHVFWANKGGAANSIGRANLDGSSPNQSFISGANEPCGVAVG